MIKAAVLGSPVSHSLSPLLHTVAYSELGLESEYTRIEVKAGELGTFLANADSTWSGFSLTMPLKEEVLDFAENISTLSLKIRSANTLMQGDSPRWSASTTDVSGFSNALAAHGRDASGRVVIIGAGATARAAAAACDGIASHISVMTRSQSRTTEMSKCIESSDVVFIDWHETEVFESADLIISTVPEGATDSLVRSLPPHPTGVFFDVLYKPWPTLALKTWSQSGAPVVDGLDLLIHQAIDQISMFSGQTIDRATMAPLLRAQGIRALSGSST